MTQHAALFDLDGVLIDSEGIYYDFWANIDNMFPTGINDFAAFIKGNTLKRIMDYFPNESERATIIRMLEEQERNMRYNIFDGAIDFLDELRHYGIPCAIVTSSNDDKMHKLFDQNPGFADYFDAVITDRQVTRSKPDPQGYILAAKKLGCQTKDCFVFEDSFSGLEAARRSGAIVIGLATTNTRESIKPLADIVINSFADFGVSRLLSVKNTASSI